MAPPSRGYAKLSTLMGQHPETAVFRRFDGLNMLNLLSLQAELTDLELQLQHIREEDDTSEDPLRMFHSIDFWELRQSRKAGDDLQWHILLSIRQKLQEYSNAFIERICKQALMLTPLQTQQCYRSLRSQRSNRRGMTSFNFFKIGCNDLRWATASFVAENRQYGGIELQKRCLQW